MKRSKFSLSYTHLLSCDMGELVPIGITEVLPGDTFQHASSVLLRVSPLLAPVMHPVHVRVHHWFVPYRLIWEDWEKFITGGPDGNDASVFPTITINPTVGSLADYLGVPTGTEREVSALPFRAYAKIWNEFYRDQDLETELVIDETSGPDTTTNITLQNCAWEKDYFTSARPFEQKGTAVTIPLVGSAPVVGLGKGNSTFASGSQSVVETTGPTTYTDYQLINPADANQSMYVEKHPTENYPGIFADLSGVSAADINDLRLAFALQRYKEARARYGSRYTEYLSYLGVRSSDARLQRPEYLGGGRQVIQFSEVLQTTPTTDGDDTIGVGNLKGHGIGAVRSNRYRRFFEEHGVVVSLLSVRPKTIYGQGLFRFWNRRVKEDFWQRELQHIGQQAIKNKEVYAAHATPEGTFGYQDMYDEYRRSESRISGEFRTTLDFWHYARLFASDPALNATFVKSVPTKRVNAVTAEDCLWVMVQHSLQARRLVAASGKSFIL